MIQHKLQLRLIVNVSSYCLFSKSLLPLSSQQQTFANNMLSCNIVYKVLVSFVLEANTFDYMKAKINASTYSHTI